MKHEIPDLDKSGLRRFALSTAAAVGILFGLLLPWLFEFSFPRWPWIFAGILAAWGVIAPSSLRMPYRLWMRMSILIGSVTTPIVLGIVFYLVILPAALIMRLIGRDTMHRRFDDGMTTYKVSSEQPDRENLERPF